MKNLKLFAVAILGLAILSACSSRDNDNVGSEQAPRSTEDIINNANLSAKEKAEKLARAGEELVQGNHFAFMYADEIFETALMFDEDNLRAQVYRALLAPSMNMRGIVTRIRPLAAKNPKYKKNLETAIKEIQQEYPKSLSNFLLDGLQDIKTEAHAQAYADSMIKVYNQSREFFKKNRDKKLTLYVSQTEALKARSKMRKGIGAWSDSTVFGDDRDPWLWTGVARQAGPMEKYCRAELYSQHSHESAPYYKSKYKNTYTYRYYNITGCPSRTCTNEKLKWPILRP